MDLSATYLIFHGYDSSNSRKNIRLWLINDSRSLYCNSGIRINEGPIQSRIIRRVNKAMCVLPANHLIWCRKLSDVESNQMVGSGEDQGETIRPQFDRSIMIDFQGAKITSDTGFLLLREIDDRFGILGPIESELEDTRSWVHSTHTQLQMVRQRVYQIAAGYEDCNDADFLRIDPALRLAVGKEHDAGAGARFRIGGKACLR